MRFSDEERGARVTGDPTGGSIRARRSRRLLPDDRLRRLRPDRLRLGRTELARRARVGPQARSSGSHRQLRVGGDAGRCPGVGRSRRRHRASAHHACGDLGLLGPDGRVRVRPEPGGARRPPVPRRPRPRRRDPVRDRPDSRVRAPAPAAALQRPDVGRLLRRGRTRRGLGLADSCGARMAAAVRHRRRTAAYRSSAGLAVPAGIGGLPDHEGP